MWYRGISKNLEQIFQKINNDISIYLDFNFDGVSLFNSSSKCFWPIIVSIRGKPKLLTNLLVFSIRFSHLKIQFHLRFLCFRVMLISQSVLLCGCLHWPQTSSVHLFTLCRLIRQSWQISLLFTNSLLSANVFCK